MLKPLETAQPAAGSPSSELKPPRTAEEVRMKSQRNIARQLFGLTLTLVGLMSWNPLPATEYKLRSATS